MDTIQRIVRAKHTSAQAAEQQINIDCEVDDETPPTLARFIIPYDIQHTPDGPEVDVQYSQARLKDDPDKGEREIPEEDLPQPVKDKARELSTEIGSW